MLLRSLCGNEWQEALHTTRMPVPASSSKPPSLTLIEQPTRESLFKCLHQTVTAGTNSAGNGPL